MNPKRLTETELEKYTAAAKPEVKELVRVTRDFILRHVPDADERFMRGHPWYERRGLFAYIARYSNHVNFGFPRGAELAADHPILEGTGKGMRHVNIRAAADLDNPAVLAVLRAAVALNDR